MNLFEVVSQLKDAVRRRPVTEFFDLPAELVPGVPKLTLSGGSEVLIENHEGLKSYSRDLIEVRGRNMLMQIRGEDLELSAMTKTELVISGIIVAVELC
ncbi:MAG: sporulation protein [Firmicutes bacterium HGW-Firmicutes-16]|nr:MAG: sporulation protein [Firmicutes bacterium HGW-Firmicutes-16]